MILTFKGLEWDEIRNNLDYMEQSLEKYMNDMDVYYDVAFVKDGIVFDFIFQYDDLETVNVYKMEV
jgi:hypothetical protein